MTTRHVLATILLTLGAEVTLLAVVVFLGEPNGTGRPAARFEPIDIGYLALPFVFISAAVAIPVHALLRDDS